MIEGKTPEEICKGFNVKKTVLKRRKPRHAKRTSGVKRSEILCVTL
jgi:hypothetical protein